ncbi:hypothetical protein [Luedemannella helvata]
MNTETELRAQMRQHITQEGRYGVPMVLVQAVDEVIDSHVIDMRAELLRHQKSEDAQIGELEARLNGLAVKYREDEEQQQDVVAHLRYQRRSARRRVEDRDTPMPAGPDGVEENGYQHGNVGELVGRGMVTRIVLLVVLLLAMLADLITFRQVVERVANDRFVFPLVLALTVTTTYVAHWAGEMFQTARETRRGIRRAVGGWTLSAVWAAMGVGAFVFRLLAPPPVSGDALGDFVKGDAATTTSTSDGSPALSAMLLLFLYVLTGAIAITAGFHRPRREIAQYRRANRRLRWARPRLAAIRRDLAEAAALHVQLAELRVSRAQLYAVELERCESAARRLKAEAAMRVERLTRASELPWYRRMISR